MPRKRVRIVDIEEARAELGRLIDALKPGEWFVISANGIPRVKVVALSNQERDRLMKEEQRGGTITAPRLSPA
jgi:antitoxin (DNA-binding transcriptional repressor) of toxin-antitoxin stability system